MTVTDTAIKFRYEGNASTDTFAFPAKAFTAADLVVEIITRATDALEETLTITTHYTVTIATDGTASIVTEAAKIPSATQDIQIRRSLAQTQTVVLPTGTKFPAKSVETAIDRAVGLSQDIDEAVNRSLKFPATSSTTVATLPEPTDDAVLAFDGTTGTFKVGATNTSLVAGATTATAQAVIATTQASNASTSATLASQWATLTSGQVASTDYSSKAYAIGGTGVTNAAGAAKEWAAKAEDSTVDGTLFSALHYSAKASDSADAAAASAAGVNLPSITATDTGALIQVNAGGTGYDKLTPGTDGKFLMSNGADTALSYEDVPSGWNLLSTQTASTSPTIDFTSTHITSTYKQYIVKFIQVLPADSNVFLAVRLSQSGTFRATIGDYSYNLICSYANIAPYAYGNNTATETRISESASNIATAGVSGTFTICDPTAAAGHKKMLFNAASLDGSTICETATGSAAFILNANALDGIRFLFESGNIASGTFKLYGIS